MQWKIFRQKTNIRSKETRISSGLFAEKNKTIAIYEIYLTKRKQ